jgi:hypothetical protein
MTSNQTRPDHRLTARILIAALASSALIALPMFVTKASGLDWFRGQEIAAEGSEALGGSPLPREWRWERKPVRFDHMFRTR